MIIGAGPCDLFQVFELGLLGIQARLFDSLKVVGAQCAEPSPEKPIYDFPALPACGAQEPVDRRMQQIRPFNPQFRLGEEVTTVIPGGAAPVEFGTPTFHEAARASFGIRHHLFAQKRQLLQYATAIPITHRRVGIPD